MPADFTFPTGAVYAFLLVMARMGGAFSFVPVPGQRSAPEAVRAVFAAASAIALYPRWPQIDPAAVGPAQLAGWAVAEAAIGLTIGVAMSVVVETFSLAAQLLGLQAGYSYASTVDPNTEADSGVLIVFAQLAAGMLFFAVGLDREVLRLLARSLEQIPPGQFTLAPGAAQAMISLTSHMLAAGLRLAMPVIAMLIMLDVSLALLGRINQQLQLLSLAFPVKMLAGLAALAWLAAVFTRIMLEMGGAGWVTARRALGI